MLTDKEFKEWEENLENLDKLLTAKYSKTLDEALDEIIAKIATTSSETMKTRLTHVKNQIEAELNTAYAKVDINDNTDSIVEETLAVLAIVGLLGTAAVLSKAALSRINNTNTVIPAVGKTLQEMENETREANKRKLKGIASAGISQGKSIDEIAKDLRAAQGSIENQHIKTIVRTANSEIQNNTLLEAYDSTTDVIGFESTAIMDRRTTEICRRLNGRKFFKVDGWNRASLQSSAYAIPRHYNCRSIWMPITPKPTKPTEPTEPTKDPKVEP